MIAFLDMIDDPEGKERFDLLYHKYKNLMASVAVKRTSNQDDIEDILQDAFFYIANNFEKIGDIDSQKTKNFVCVITNGFAIRKYRKERRSAPTDDFSEIADSELDAYDIAELKILIDTLNDEEKNFVYLKYVFGYKSKEIARMYDVKDEYVRKKLQFAKRHIKAGLEAKK